MKLIKWSQEYSVNHDELDRQHKELIEIINEVYIAIKEEKEYIPITLERLMKDAKFHFKYEEGLMDKAGYPLTDTHKKQHKKFTYDLLSFIDDFLTKSNIESKDLLNFFEVWLVYHILESDIEFTSFLNKQLVK
jgi:hemerythrin